MKKFVLIILILIIGLLVVFFSYLRLKKDELVTFTFPIISNQYGFSVMDKNGDRPIFKISTFDDFYYTPKNQKHILDRSRFESSSKSTSWIKKLLQKISNIERERSWRFQGKDSIDVVYKIEEKEDKKFVISRKVNQINPETYAIGQSLVFCQGCLLTDKNKRIFYSDELLKQEKLDFAGEKELTPIIISKKLLPSGLSEVIIVDSEMKPVISIKISANQQAFYDEKWNLLELKTFIGKQRPVQISQSIELYK